MQLGERLQIFEDLVLSPGSTRGVRGPHPSIGYNNPFRCGDGAENILWKPQDALQMLFLWGSYHQHLS